MFSAANASGAVFCTETAARNFGLATSQIVPNCFCVGKSQPNSRFSISQFPDWWRKGLDKHALDHLETEIHFEIRTDPYYIIQCMQRTSVKLLSWLADPRTSFLLEGALTTYV